jgi:RNA polymerase sigma-70 factor (ECF subfamily)
MPGIPAEHELLSKAIAGDRDALRELLALHHRQFTRHISVRIPAGLRSTLSTDDVTQQAYVHVIRQIRHFRPRTFRSFLPWLRKIGENCLRDAIRAHKSFKRGGDRQQLTASLGENDSVMAECLEAVATDSHTPSSSAARHELIASVRECLDGLPEHYRQAVELYFFKGKSLKEVSTTMQRSPRAVQGLLDRAKVKMRDALGSFSLYK